MKKHIHILHIGDFFIAISKEDPDAHKVMIEETIKVNQSSFDEEELKQNLDRVNMWIGNCDQKSSIVLAVIGVAMTVLLTSDFAKYVRHTLVMPMKKVLPQLSEAWNGWQWLMAVLIVAVIVFGIASIYHLLLSLRAKTDLNKFGQAGMQTNSMLHYVDVSKRTYKEYCEDKVELLNDLRTQVYVNSCICTSKFNQYRKGIKRLEWAIAMCVILGLLILIY